MLVIAPVVEELICRNFMDASNTSRFIDSPFFANAKSLRVLKFELCPHLKPAALGMLMANIHKLPSLTELDLTEAEVETEAFGAMEKSCVPSSSLMSLRLPKTKYHAAVDGEAVGKLLTKLTGLVKLSIHIRTSHLRDLASMFDSVGNLQKLTQFEILSHSGNLSYSDVASAVRRLKKLQSLYVAIQGSPNDTGVQELLEAIATHPSITRLASPSMHRESLAGLMSGIFLRNTTIQALDIHNTAVSELDIVVLSDVVAQNKTLTSLDLKTTQRVLPGSWEALGRALAQNSSMKWLNIVGLTGIVPDAHLPMIEALGENHSLTVVHLGGPVGAASADAIGRILAKNTSLTKLTLTSAPDVDCNLSGIFGGLAKNSTLRFLQITSGPIKLNYVQSLIDGLAQNRELVTLCFSGCYVSKEAYNLFLPSLATNESLYSIVFNSCSFFVETPATHTVLDLFELPEGKGPKILWNVEM